MAAVLTLERFVYDVRFVESRAYFARPIYPCAIVGIATIWFLALAVPQPP
jgi:hypothetical protein